MAVTPNLELPLFDGSMTADVPRDMNALAVAVDTVVPAVIDDLAGVGRTVETVKGNADSIAAHSALQTAHGAVSAPTASKIMARDANGRAQVASPSSAADIARKDTVDAVQANLTAHEADNVTQFESIDEEMTGSLIYAYKNLGGTF